jgi:hypothetical protein
MAQRRIVTTSERRAAAGTSALAPSTTATASKPAVLPANTFSAEKEIAQINSRIEQMLGVGAVTQDQLSDGAVTSAKLSRTLAFTPDGRHVTDGAITTATTALTSAAAAFTAGDVGKSLMVIGAGAAGVALITTIAAFVSSTTVTLANAAATTVSGANVVWGTDASEAIQNALDELAGTGEALLIPPGAFVVAEPITVPSHTTIEGSEGAILWAMLAPSGEQSESVFVRFIDEPIGSGTISTTPARTNSVVVTGWTGTAPAAGQVLGLQSGNSFSTYDVVSVSGSGPYTLTLDRAIAVPFVATNPAHVYAEQPNNIRIYGNGLKFRGVCDRYIELGAVHHGHIEDCHTDSVGGGTPSPPANGCFSWDTGGRNVGFARCTVDLTGVSTAVFGIALESIDGGYITDCAVKGGDTGFYRVDCHAVALRNCYASRTGRGTGGGSGFSVGKSATGLGSFDCRVIDCHATDCHYGISIGAGEDGVAGFDAVRCATAINVNSGAGAVKMTDVRANYSTQIAILASDCTISGLRAIGLAGAPADGLISVTGGTTRITDAKIISTATTFIAAAIKLAGGTALEVSDSVITLADAANAYGIYATSGSVKVRNLTVNGSVTGGIRLDAGLVGFIGPDCDFSSAALPIFASSNAGWSMQPTGRAGSIAMANANQTATFAQAYVDILKATGALTANRTLTLPFNALGHIWTINNATTGGFSVVVSFGTGTTVTCAAGITRVYFDGTNAVQA